MSSALWICLVSAPISAGRYDKRPMQTSLLWNFMPSRPGSPLSPLSYLSPDVCHCRWQVSWVSAVREIWSILHSSQQSCSSDQMNHSLGSTDEWTRSPLTATQTLHALAGTILQTLASSCHPLWAEPYPLYHAGSSTLLTTLRYLTPLEGLGCILPNF